jgi:cell division protein FtsX
MKLVGAKYHFIRSGFIVEGVLFGLIGLGISIGLSQLLLGYLARNLVGLLSNESILAGVNAILLHFDERFWLTLTWQLGATLIASGLSSYLAIELYLRKEG